MNERINELRLDAGISLLHDEPYLVAVNKSGNIEDPMIGLEKFAQLIVRECIAQAVKEEERYDSLGGRDCEYCSMAMANFQEVLAKHFGVEE